MTFVRLYLMYREFGHDRILSVRRAWETVRRTSL